MRVARDLARVEGGAVSSRSASETGAVGIASSMSRHAEGGQGVPSLRTAKLVAELERSWRVACERGGFRLAHYSIQNDHVHMIVEAGSARDLACGLEAIAARFARGVAACVAGALGWLRDEGFEEACVEPHWLRSRRAIRYREDR